MRRNGVMKVYGSRRLMEGVFYFPKIIHTIFPLSFFLCFNLYYISVKAWLRWRLLSDLNLWYKKKKTCMEMLLTCNSTPLKSSPPFMEYFYKSQGNLGVLLCSRDDVWEEAGVCGCCGSVPCKGFCGSVLCRGFYGSVLCRGFCGSMLCRGWYEDVGDWGCFRDIGS